MVWTHLAMDASTQSRSTRALSGSLWLLSIWKLASVRPPKLHTLLLSHPRAIAPAPSHRLEIPAQKRGREKRGERETERSQRRTGRQTQRGTQRRVLTEERTASTVHCFPASSSASWPVAGNQALSDCAADTVAVWREPPPVQRQRQRLRRERGGGGGGGGGS